MDAALGQLKTVQDLKTYVSDVLKRDEDFSEWSYHRFSSKPQPAHAGWLHSILKPSYDGLCDAEKAPPGCLDGTRRTLLEEMDEWLESPTSEQVFWLSGLGGTGKSTVCRSACERFKRKQLLLASFFLSRNSTDRRDPKALLHTVVSQCARRFPEFFAHVRNTLTHQPEMLSRPIAEQVAALFTASLNAVTETSTPAKNLVIVIDAFDECAWEDNRQGGNLLPSLLDAVHDAPAFLNLKLLVTSRAEHALSSVFEQHRQRHQSSRLHDIEKEIVKADVRLYLRHEFTRIAREHDIPDPESWPPSAQLETLVEKTGGLFVYAATVIRYVNHRTLSPMKRLEALLNAGPNPQTSSSPFSILDALYTQVLIDAIDDESNGDDEAVMLLRSIVGALVLLQDPLTVVALSRLLSIDEGETRRMIQRLGAILIYSDVDPVQLYHPSFPDYVLDAERCRDLRFRIEAEDHHGALAGACLDAANAGLKRNICGIEDESLPNRDVPDLASRIASTVPEELRYACRHWLLHLSLAPLTKSDLLVKCAEFTSTLR